MQAVKSPRFDFLVAIGRFEPFHNGHAAMLSSALKQARRVIVLIGSANKPRTVKNPWTAQERERMLLASLPEVDAERIRVRRLEDDLYNDQKWVADVQALVKSAIDSTEDRIESPAIGLIGHRKDRSSYYLEMFPQWELVEVPALDMLSASDLRNLLLQGPLDDGAWMVLAGLVPPAVLAYLKAFARTPYFEQLVREHAFIAHYRKAWEVAPHAPTFVTTDAVVIHSGHVLLVQRKAEPGKGLWALPGGFVGTQEFIFDACLRELREETRLKIPAPVLRGSVKGEKVFDHPERSARGRTITHAFLFEFPAGALPPIKGGDDAARARWVPLAQALEMDSVMFEDHMSILRYFVGRA